MESDVVTCAVYDFDDEGVAVAHFQSGARELPIDCDYVVSSAQPLHWCCLNLMMMMMIRS